MKVPTSLHTCVIEEAFDFLLNETMTEIYNRSECTRAQIPCETKEYTATYKVEQTYLENKHLVWLVFENPRVEYYHTYISNDLLTLIAEVGGILGITLGASALTMFDKLFQSFSQGCQNVFNLVKT